MPKFDYYDGQDPDEFSEVPDNETDDSSETGAMEVFNHQSSGEMNQPEQFEQA